MLSGDTNSLNLLVFTLFILQTDDGEDDLKKGTQLLEIYALEIQMYTAQKNNKKLKVHSIVIKCHTVYN